MTSGPLTANAARLAGAEAAERRGQLLLTMPGLLLVLVLLVVPLVWLIVLSAFGADGELSLENYARLGTPLYVHVLVTTLKISLLTTALVALLSYPVAYLLSQLPARLATLGLFCVILPFWTSVLVRTYAWLVLLQRNGLVNSGLESIGAIDQPLGLVHNEIGTIVGMVHVMMPYMIMPLYAAMRSIDQLHMDAAATCGASPSRAFFDVFLPQTRSALFAGVVLVFVLCLGFYLTPALLGGGNVTMVSMQIESNVREYGNWGAASALGAIIIAVTVVTLGVLRRALRIDPQVVK